MGRESSLGPHVRAAPGHGFHVQTFVDGGLVCLARGVRRSKFTVPVDNSRDGSEKEECDYQPQDNYQPSIH
jgi:hypothetical protein